MRDCDKQVLSFVRYCELLMGGGNRLVMELSVVIGGRYRLSFQNLLSRLLCTKFSFFFLLCVRHFGFGDIGNIYTNFALPHESLGFGPCTAREEYGTVLLWGAH